MKLSLLLAPPDPTAERALTAALASQTGSTDSASVVHHFAAGILGVVGRPGVAPGALPVRRTAAGDLLAVAGTPLVRDGRVAGVLDELARRLAAGAPSAEVVERLTTLEGHFAAVLWHAGERRTSVVTDALGMQPLYRGEAGAGTFYATDLRAVAAWAPETIHFDPAAWGAFFYIGHPIGDRTPLAGVRRVPGAVVRTHAPDDPGGRERTWWRWPALEGTLPVEEAAARLVEELRADVAAGLRESPETTLLLSGGFDSRLILAILAEQGARPRLITHSHPDENGDADGRFAVATARLYGLPIEWERASPGFFRTGAYLDYVRRSEVVAPSLYLFIAQVAALVTPGLHAVWDGCMVGPSLKFAGGAATMDAYLQRRVAGRRAAARRAAARVLAPEWVEAMDEGFDALIAEEVARVGDGPAATFHFQFNSRHRVRIGQNPYQVYASQVPTFTPGLAARSWEAACAAHPDDRRTRRLCETVFRRHYPHALRVPVASSTDLLNPGGSVAGAARLQWQRARAGVSALARRPKVAGLLRAGGVRVGFHWEPSPFVAAAPATHALPATVVDRSRAAALRPGAPGFADAAEVVFYLEAWRRLMRGEPLDPASTVGGAVG